MLGYASLTRVIRKYKVLLYLLYNEERMAKLCFDADCFHNCAVLMRQRGKTGRPRHWCGGETGGTKTLRSALSTALKTSSQTTPQSTQFFPPSRNSPPNTRFSRDFVTAYHSGVYNLSASFNTPHPTFHAAKSHLSHLDTWSFAPRSLTFRASKA